MSQSAPAAKGSEINRKKGRRDVSMHAMLTEDAVMQQGSRCELRHGCARLCVGKRDTGFRSIAVAIGWHGAKSFAAETVTILSH